jgi:hypothetical protein
MSDRWRRGRWCEIEDQALRKKFEPKRTRESLEPVKQSGLPMWTLGADGAWVRKDDHPSARAKALESPMTGAPHTLTGEACCDEP